MKKIATLRPLDLIIFIVCLGSFIYSIYHLPNASGTEVKIFCDNRLLARYPLSSNLDATFHGNHDSVTVQIKNGKTSIIHSGCPEKICVMSGAISRPAQQIICAPNHIVVTITDKEGSFDAVTQ